MLTDIEIARAATPRNIAEIAAATAGVVAENAVEITRTFYPRHLVLQRRGPLQQ